MINMPVAHGTGVANKKHHSSKTVGLPSTGTRSGGRRIRWRTSGCQPITNWDSQLKTKGE